MSIKEVSRPHVSTKWVEISWLWKRFGIWCI